MIQAVDKHQGLLRASVANIGQDHRLGANEAPPAIISIFLGAELEKVFEAIVSGEGDPHTPAAVLGLGTPVLPPLPMHGGDRNRTSPFAFTGNKFEFRALGSSMSLAFPNTVLNTIVAEAIDDLADKLEAQVKGGTDLDEALTAVVKEAYGDHQRVIFAGDNYTDEWHAEAESRGLKNLRTTPDALPEVLSEPTVAAFEKYEVLSHRGARVALRGLARAVHHHGEHRGRDGGEHREDDAAAGGAAPRGAGRGGRDGRAGRRGALADRVLRRGDRRARRRRTRTRTAVEGMELAEYARDNQLAVLARVREVGDELEKIVADDLWPLPKYSKITSSGAEGVSTRSSPPG